jgi:hypothetical protein
MLPLLELDVLSCVAGGQNVNSITSTSGEQQITSSSTDTAYCVKKVTDACQASSPGFLGFGTDQAKANQCMATNLPKVCATTAAQ